MSRLKTYRATVWIEGADMRPDQAKGCVWVREAETPIDFRIDVESELEKGWPSGIKITFGPIGESWR